MKFLEFAALTVTVSTVAAQAVTGILKPTAPNPTGCRTSVPSSFNLFKSELAGHTKRQDGVTQAETANALQVYLNNTVLTDSLGRTGAIVANYQFQFDGPPQAGTIYTAGYCLLANNSLVLGSSAVWWSCNSGGFDNLYDRWWADQCRPVLLNAFNLAGTTATTTATSSGASSTHNITLTDILTSSAPHNGTATHASTAATSTGNSTSVTRASNAPASSTSSTGGAALPTAFRIEGAAVVAGILGMAALL